MELCVFPDKVDKCLLLFLLMEWSCVYAQMGLPSTPTINMVTPQTTSINLAWNQSAVDVVESYTISYSYVTRGCEGTVLGADMITGIDGSIRTYSLSNIEENSDFDISITAVNGAGSSPVPARTSSTTLVAAPSGIVTSLMTTAITSTTVSMSWGRVACIDRNTEITSYALIYGPSSDSSDRKGSILMDINTNNVYTITGLLPRTDYTIQVRADHATVFGTLMGTVSATVNAETAVPEALGFLLKGTPYLNNSVVALTAIGADNNALICLTNFTACCSNSETGDTSFLGDWRLPDGSLVPGGASGSTASIITTRGASAVLLHRRNNVMVPTGVFTCEVPDSSGVLRFIYIYIYVGQVTGVLSITDISSDHLALTLTCTSSGRPIDSVTWFRDGSEVSGDSSEFSQTQRITDRVTATYQHILSIGSAADFVGRFTCEVRDGSGVTASRTLALNGVTIVTEPLPFTVGQDAVLTCFSDTGVVDRIQWVSRDGVVLASDTSVQQLQFMLSPVNDSLSVHTSFFTCSVTKDEGRLNQTISNQTQPVTVAIPSPAISVNISRSGSLVAGSEYSLTCVVSELIAGLTEMPSALWERFAGAQIPSEAVQESSRTGGMAMAVLQFNPLKALSNGGYRCRGTLVSPAKQNPLEETAREDIRVQIPAPTVIVTVLNDSLVAGGMGDVTLTCLASLDLNVVDSGDLEFSFSWRDRENIIILTGGRISISSSSTSSSSMLTLSPLSTTDTSFSCTAVVSERQKTLEPSAPGSKSISIDVQSPDPPGVTITSSGSYIAGTTCIFTCHVTLAQDLREIPVIEWVWPNGTRIENGTLEGVSVFSTSPSTTLTLTFASLRTSHGGIYRCRASIVDSNAQLSLSGNSSYNLTVQIPALDVVVVLRSFPVDSNFYTGLELNLTCIVHLSPTGLDVPTSMAVSADWSKSGTSLTTNSRVTVDKGPVEVGPLQYQTSLLFESLDKTRDEGNYTCSVHVIHSLEGFLDAVTDTAASLSVTLQTVLFQLKLTGVSNCASWRSIDLVSKDMDMVEELVKFMAANCDCNFSVDRLTDRMFVCHPSSPQSVTYQAQLHGTLQAPVADFITLLEEWAFSGVTIQVQHLSLTLDGVCVSPSSSTVEYEATEPTKMEDKFSIGVQSVYIIATVIVVVVVVFVLIITVLIITVVVLNSKLQSKKESKRVGTIPLSYVGTLTDNTGVYEDIESVQSKATPISTSEVDDVKTETCPAYLPLTHQHQPPVAGDTSEQQLYEDVRSYAA